MEYFIGSFVMLVTLLSFQRFAAKQEKTLHLKPIRYSQSKKFELTRYSFNPSVFPSEKKKSQSRNHVLESTLRVILIDDSAYWIGDNSLFTAKVVDGEIDQESTKKVDTMGMDKVQLDKTIFIVEKLREGLEDDSSDSGN